VDDMISTGGTLAECGDAVAKAGGSLWGVVATHGLFVNGAPDKLKSIPRIYVADTVSPFRLKGTETMKRVQVVPMASMFAAAISRIHIEGGSISELLED
jgi:ribose-phosphate pyrophosphokinase